MNEIRMINAGALPNIPWQEKPAGLKNAAPLWRYFYTEKKAGHVHNVSKPQLKESIEVNRRMINFLTRYGSASLSDR